MAKLGEDVAGDLGRSCVGVCSMLIDPHDTVESDKSNDAFAPFNY